MCIVGDNMNKRGFTLIELIAVLAVLGILLMMAVPNINGIFEDKKEELYNSTVSELERITGQYLVANPSLYGTIDENGYVDIEVSTLCTAKYISCPITDPRDNSEITGYVRITYVDNDYTYEFVRNTNVGFDPEEPGEEGETPNPGEGNEGGGDNPGSTVITYTLTLNGDGVTVSPSTITVTQNEEYSGLPTLTRTGYTFLGWFIGDTEIKNGDKVTITSNQEATAKWQANTYTINYELNGGTKGTNAPTAGIFDEVLTIDNPTKEGYTFTGWTVTSGLNSNTAKYGVTETTVVSQIENSETKVMSMYFKNLTADNNASVTLTANFSEGDYTLVLNADGGTVDPSEITVTHNGTYSNLPTPTRDGYIFAGWFIGLSEIKTEDKVTITSNAEATAKWLKLTNGVTYITNLQTTAAIANGLIKDDTDDENIRYAGSNDDVKNYVYYNCLDEDAKGTSYGKYGYDYENSCELWRIIGIFDVSNGTTTANRIKLIRDESLLNASWDSSAEGINGGSGINQWGEVKNETGNITYEGADLMRLLNGYYLRKEGTTCTYCDGGKQSTCPTANNCSSTVTPLSTIAQNMIDNAVWNLGNIVFSYTILLSDMYNAEKEEQDGSTLCVESKGSTYENCNDGINRTTQWKGKVGLIYPSDYGYASTNVNCANNIIGSDSSCEGNNWLHILDGEYWTILSHASSNYAYGGWIVSNSSKIASYKVATSRMVRPSVYLNSNVAILEGTDGTSGNPYILHLDNN